MLKKFLDFYNFNSEKIIHINNGVNLNKIDLKKKKFKNLHY